MGYFDNFLALLFVFRAKTKDFRTMMAFREILIYPEKIKLSSSSTRNPTGGTSVSNDSLLAKKITTSVLTETNTVVNWRNRQGKLCSLTSRSPITDPSVTKPSFQ